MRNRTLKYFLQSLDNVTDLSTKEKFVVLKRLKSNSLVKIGKKLKVSESRIRQIEKKALHKLNRKWRQLQLFK